MLANHGATASGLGRGNAAHAAAPARANAAPHSAVGTAVAYGAAREAAAEAEAALSGLEDDLHEALDAQAELDPATATDQEKLDAQKAVDDAQQAVDDAQEAIDAEQPALEAAVKDPTEAIGNALADLLGID